MSDLNKTQYVQLKNLSYQMYILDYKTNSNKAKNLLKQETEKYDHDEMKRVVYNTLLFPFDLELFDFIKNKDFNETTVSLASEKFDIPLDLIKQKVSEYIKYGFLRHIENGAIDYKEIDFISKQLLSNRSESEKNTKLS